MEFAYSFLLKLDLQRISKEKEIKPLSIWIKEKNHFLNGSYLFNIKSVRSNKIKLMYTAIAIRWQ